ncbi:MAG: hypothetical protein IPL53_22360 [Ignavibacteria bacterium]|nr:hypothetical protein [Ignavibacteria bacterium]
MNKFTGKASLLLYLMAVLVFFILGGLFVKFSGAAEGQGLAAGAIVFVYCIIFALAALAASIFFVHYSSPKSVVIANRILLIIFVILIGIFSLGSLNPEEKRMMANEFENSMGLGFFKPDYYEKPILYFYSSPDQNKSVQEHPADDSVGFTQKETGGFEISYAPPWLKPEHLKLDYDILFFKVESLTKEFAEVTVNDVTHETKYIDRNAGKILLWPDFLLQVHSVEFKEPGLKKIRIKPLSYAGEVNIAFQIMKPVIIKDEWMLVELFDDNYEKTGEGWIEWNSNNQLLISYSLLS